MTKTESRISNKKTLVNVSLELLHIFYTKKKEKKIKIKKQNKKTINWEIIRPPNFTD